MILIAQLKNYFVAKKEQLEGIESIHVVMSQEHLTEVIRNEADWPCLVVVVPGAKTDARDEDNIRDPSNVIVMLVEKIDLKDLPSGGITTRMNLTQVTAEKLKWQMLTDMGNHSEPNHLMHDLDPDSIITEPEYNYIGTYGWSISFNINPILRQLL